jgi:hypothetical protein
MADTTERIPLWLIGTITGIPVIGLVLKSGTKWCSKEEQPFPNV